MWIFVVILNVAFSFIRLVKMAIHPSIHLHNHFLVGWAGQCSHTEKQALKVQKLCLEQSCISGTGKFHCIGNGKLFMFVSLLYNSKFLFSSIILILLLKNQNMYYLYHYTLIRCFPIITSKILMAHERIL